jgi:hypothetical protein
VHSSLKLTPHQKADATCRLRTICNLHHAPLSGTSPG